MPSIRRFGRRARSAILVSVVSLVCGACSSTGGNGANTGGSTPSGTALVGFVTSAATASNGAIPTGTAIGTCGSAKYGWVSEMAHVSVTSARVRRHWAAFIKTDHGLAAKQMEAAGTIANLTIGSTDVPFDHPFGGDMSFDEHVDAPYRGLDQNLGNSGGNAPGVVHDELMTGLLPHPPGTVDVSTGTSWPIFAASTGSNIAPGFTPQAGDRVAVLGSWVVDCGHTDFHSELHSVTFMAYGHRVGAATVAHAFYNPYGVAQVFNPNPGLAGRVTDRSILSSPSTQDLPSYLTSEILRLAQGIDRQPIAPAVLEPNMESPTPWVVCAPPGTAGTHLAVSYDFSVRPGVQVGVHADQSDGCAVITTRLEASYRPSDAPGGTLCPTDWTWLSEHAFGEASTFGGTGNVPHNIPQVIIDQVKRFAPNLVGALSHRLFKPLLSVCFPVMTGRLGNLAPGVHSTQTSVTQILPFVGWVEVAWAK